VKTETANPGQPGRRPVQSPVAGGFLHQCRVVPEARRAPEVGQRMFVAGIEGGHDLQNARIQVRQVLELRLVERTERARLDQVMRRGSARPHHVVTGAAGQQLGLQDFVRVVDVVVDLDAGPRLEVLDRRLGDVVGPVVDVQDLLTVGGRSGIRLVTTTLAGSQDYDQRQQANKANGTSHVLLPP